MILAAAIYFRPVADRYSFEKFDEKDYMGVHEWGWLVKDSATGKIHKWTNRMLGEDIQKDMYTSTVTTDPVRTPYQKINLVKKARE